MSCAKFPLRKVGFKFEVSHLRIDVYSSSYRTGEYNRQTLALIAAPSCLHCHHSRSEMGLSWLGLPLPNTCPLRVLST